MKAILIALLVIVSYTFAVVPVESDDCPAVIQRARLIYATLPPDVRGVLKMESTKIVLSVFPSIDRKRLDQLIKDFETPSVNPTKVCEDARALFEPLIIGKEECFMKCINDLGLTPEKIVEIVLKCKKDAKCFAEVIEEYADKAVPCLKGCVGTTVKANPDQCPQTVQRARTIFLTLPGPVKDVLKNLLFEMVFEVFPTVDKAKVEQLYKDFTTPSVNPAKVCEDARELFEPLIIGKEECFKKCVESLGLTPEKILEIVMKCRQDPECYRTEIKKYADIAIPCLKKC